MDVNHCQRSGSHTGWYYWEIFLDVPKDILARIQYVRYILHPIFADRIKTVKKPDEGFKLIGYGWGEFSVKIEITLNNNDKLEKYHWLKLIGPKPLDA